MVIFITTFTCYLSHPFSCRSVNLISSLCCARSNKDCQHTNQGTRRSVVALPTTQQHITGVRQLLSSKTERPWLSVSTACGLPFEVYLPKSKWQESTGRTNLDHFCLYFHGSLPNIWPISSYLRSTYIMNQSLRHSFPSSEIICPHSIVEEPCSFPRLVPKMLILAAPKSHT